LLSQVVTLRAQTVFHARMILWASTLFISVHHA